MTVPIPVAELDVGLCVVRLRQGVIQLQHLASERTQTLHLIHWPIADVNRRAVDVNCKQTGIGPGKVRIEPDGIG
jgi:hypothetical protein